MVNNFVINYSFLLLLSDICFLIVLSYTVLYNITSVVVEKSITGIDIAEYV